MLDIFCLVMGVTLLFLGVTIIATRRVTPPPGYRANLVGLSRCLGGYFCAMGAVLLGGTLAVLYIPGWPDLLSKVRLLLPAALLVAMVIHSGRYIDKDTPED